jgi:hypothetical protein
MSDVQADCWGTRVPILGPVSGHRAQNQLKTQTQNIDEHLQKFATAIESLMHHALPELARVTVVAKQVQHSLTG